MTWLIFNFLFFFLLFRKLEHDFDVQINNVNAIIGPVQPLDSANTQYYCCCFCYILRSWWYPLVGCLFTFSLSLYPWYPIDVSLAWSYESSTNGHLSLSNSMLITDSLPSRYLWSKPWYFVGLKFYWYSNIIPIT